MELSKKKTVILEREWLDKAAAISSRDQITLFLVVQFHQSFPLKSLLKTKTMPSYSTEELQQHLQEDGELSTHRRDKTLIDEELVQ